MYQSELEAWTFQDALLRGAPAEASEAQVRLHELIAQAPVMVRIPRSKEEAHGWQSFFVR